MSDKPYFEMADDELQEAHRKWTGLARNASGWPSAYCAARELEKICSHAAQRGMTLPNDFPIVKASP